MAPQQGQRTLSEEPGRADSRLQSQSVRIWSGQDVEGHLSKYNEDAALDGIFSQDWELRYFILSGTTLFYFTSEREVTFEPRGVLTVPGCTVSLNPSTPPAWGPVIFSLTDPAGVHLLTLKADSQKDAVMWLSGFETHGCGVQGLAALKQQQQHHEGEMRVDKVVDIPVAAAAAAAAVPVPAAAAAGEGGRGAPVAAVKAAAQGEGGLGSRELRPKLPLFRLQSERWEKTSNPDEVLNQDDLDCFESGDSHSDLSASSPQSHSSSKPALVPEPWRYPSPPEFEPQLSVIRSSLASDKQAEAGETAVTSTGDTSDTSAAAGATGRGTSPMSIATGAPVLPTPFATAPAVAIAAAAAASQGEVGIPEAAAPAAPAAVASIRLQLSRKGSKAAAAAVAAGGPGGTRRPGMVGSTPVHLTVQDSPLSFGATWRSPHEGVLNLMLVIVVASNLRWMLDNLLKYGLRLTLLRLDYQSIMKQTTWADLGALAALVGHVGFVMVGLWAERAGVEMVKRELKAAAAAAKKSDGDPAVNAGIKASAKQAAAATEYTMFVMNAVNLSVAILFPCGLVYFGTCHMLIGLALTLAAIVHWMKLVSYAHCNSSLRDSYRRRLLQPILRHNTAAAVAAVQPESGDGQQSQHQQQQQQQQAQLLRPSNSYHTIYSHNGALVGANGTGSSSCVTSGSPGAPVPQPVLGQSHSYPQLTSSSNPPAAAAAGAVVYPQNLTLRNLAYFMVAPTLIYQLNYPRREKIRWAKLGRWVVALVLGGALYAFIIDQYFIPSMVSGMRPFSEMNYVPVMAAVLKLALPNLYGWLVMFYVVFHVWLNILGEVTRFGDRVFYKEWWNAATLGDYWKLWNIPVHKWMWRTIYFPLLRRKWNRLAAALVVFFWSAVLHEVAVGVPLRMLRGWAFWAMFGQIPLMAMTEYLRKRLKNDSLGNIIFWTSFCVLGQPLCVLLYYHDYILQQMGPEGLRALASKVTPPCASNA